MKEIREGLMRCLEQNRRAVLATIVQVQGSAYRREGARCLIYDTGEVLGILSGGCVEADLVEHARDVFETNMAKQVDYDFRSLNDEVWGLGLGCNGTITVWLQPFDPAEGRGEAEALLLEFQHRAVCEESYTFAAVVASSDPVAIHPGNHWRLTEQQLDDYRLPETKTGLQECRIDGVEVTLFVERVTPPPRLAIIGSGPDAALLAKRAAELEWRVSVIDHRETFLNAYFSDVQRIPISRGDYGAAHIHPNSYVVVMTHNLDLDRLAFAALLPLDIRYVGVLGSRQRIGKIWESLAESGQTMDDHWLDKVYSPVGLDIGAETPEEITLSILSELIAIRNGRLGGSLRNLKEYCARHAIR